MSDRYLSRRCFLKTAGCGILGTPARPGHPDLVPRIKLKVGREEDLDSLGYFGFPGEFSGTLVSMELEVAE